MYKGPRVGIINSIDIIKVWEIAFSIASLTMFDRIIKIISILSFLMSVSMAAFGYVAIRYMQSPEFERTLKNKLLGSIEKKLPDVMKQTMPNLTGPSIPIPKK